MTREGSAKSGVCSCTPVTSSTRTFSGAVSMDSASSCSLSERTISACSASPTPSSPGDLGML